MIRITNSLPFFMGKESLNRTIFPRWRMSSVKNDDKTMEKGKRE